VHREDRPQQRDDKHGSESFHYKLLPLVGNLGSRSEQQPCPEKWPRRPERARPRTSMRLRRCAVTRRRETRWPDSAWQSAPHPGDPSNTTAWQVLSLRSRTERGRARQPRALRARPTGRTWPSWPGSRDRASPGRLPGPRPRQGGRQPACGGSRGRERGNPGTLREVRQEAQGGNAALAAWVLHLGKPATRDEVLLSRASGISTPA
jgi:hypothetical protein